MNNKLDAAQQTMNVLCDEVVTHLLDRWSAHSSSERQFVICILSDLGFLNEPVIIDTDSHSDQVFALLSANEILEARVEALRKADIDPEGIDNDSLKSNRSLLM